MIVSILNQKGGAGKTTIAINLARAMVLNDCGKVLLVDSDPQGSARNWHVQANGELLNVVGLDRPTIDKDINSVIHDYEWVFVDGAAGVSMPGMVNKMLISTIKCSDVILIPVQPSFYDLRSTEDFISLISERITWTGGKLKAAFIVSRQIPNTVIGKECRDVLNLYKVSHGIDTFESGTFGRIVYCTAAAMGSTVFDVKDNEAAKEMMSMAEELRRFVV